MSAKIWLITGASRGFGRIWAEAALARGDKVAATPGDLAGLSDLKERFGDSVLPLTLDATDVEQVRQAVQQAHAHFGRLDVVLNNAGYSLVVAIEQGDADDAGALFDVSVFGTLRVIQAVLPLLRQQGGGHILGVSSSLGLVPLPLIGSYCASKAAMESLHESLAVEVERFGIKVTLLEPGAYGPEFGTSASLKFAAGMEVYADFRARIGGRISAAERGDPRVTADAILKIVDADEAPLRCTLGDETLLRVRTAYHGRLTTWAAWEAVSDAARGAPTESPVAEPLAA